MNIVAIIQARLGSTRLPGKVLNKVDGKTLLSYQIDRIRKANMIDKIVVATTLENTDQPIVQHCYEMGVDFYRGSEDDVLSRYYETAKKYDSDVIVRLTSDCPLIDPVIIDNTIKLFIDSGSNYASNTVPPDSSTFPDGSDVEVFDFLSLERAFNECSDRHDREHVTFYFWKYKNDFKTIQLKNGKDFSKYRITVDYPEDFEVIKFLITEIKKKKLSGNLNEIIKILDSNPEIKNLNSSYYFGMGWKETK